MMLQSMRNHPHPDYNSLFPFIVKMKEMFVTCVIPENYLRRNPASDQGGSDKVLPFQTPQFGKSRGGRCPGPLLVQHMCNDYDNGRSCLCNHRLRVTLTGSEMQRTSKN